jgi:hypothetical protein
VFAKVDDATAAASHKSRPLVFCNRQKDIQAATRI